MADDVELLPCPFCGEGEHLLVEQLEGTILHPAHRIRCDNCGASTGYTDKDFRANWNTRACVAHATAAKDAEIEALRAEARYALDNAARSLTAARTARDVAEARAERLAEALQKAEEYIDDVTPTWASGGQGVLATIRAASTPPPHRRMTMRDDLIEALGAIADGMRDAGEHEDAAILDRAADALEAAREDAERHLALLADCVEPVEWASEVTYGEFSDYAANEKFVGVLARIRAAIDQARGKGIVPEQGEAS